MSSPGSEFLEQAAYPSGSLGPFSPSDRVAYLANDGGYWQVWTCDPNGQNRRQITNSKFEKSSIAWFPDGERILVHALAGELSVVDVDTGDEVPLFASSFIGHDAVVSPDGSVVAVSTSLTPTLDTNQIVLVDILSGDQEVMPAAGGMQHSPSWSADGAWLYFVSPTNSKYENNIWRISRDGDRVDQLTAGAAYFFDVTSAPNNSLSYSSNQSGDYEIWVWDLAGGVEPRQLTKRDGFDGDPDWNPAGTHVVYESRVGTASEIWIVDARSGMSEKLVSHTLGARAPVWWGRGE